MRRAILILLLLASLLVPQKGGGDGLAAVHSWTDDEGVLHLSQDPAKARGKKPSGDSAAEPEARQKRPTQAAPLPQGKGPLFMWKVTGDETFSYLLGSMHLVKKDFYPLDPRIEAAFRQCEVLAVESDVEARGEEIQALTMKLGMYGEGESLEQHVSQRTLDKLQEVGAMNPMFMRFKPWLLAMQLQSMEFMKRGFDQSLGLDRHFLVEAKQRNMPVKELEDAAETLRILADASQGREDEFLYYSLLELERFDEVISGLTRNWEAGDAAGMQELIFYELNRRPEFHDLGVKLFDERNVKMARKVAKYMRSDRPHFVVVGAGHLVGETGIPKLLRGKGYDVRQVGAD